MIERALEDQFKAVVAATHGYLKSKNYTKIGLKFRRIIDGNPVIVHFQRSTTNTADCINFTVNLAIVSKELATAYENDVSKASCWDGHVRERIGFFLSRPQDIWWTINVESEPYAVFAEFLPLLKSATQFCEDNASDRALIALWESGQAPGLTEGARVRLLTELKQLVRY